MSPSNSDRIRESIIGFLAQTLGPEQIKALDHQANLIALHIVDSRSFLDLLTHLEDSFDINLDLTDYTPNQYTSINGLTIVLENFII